MTLAKGANVKSPDPLGKQFHGCHISVGKTVPAGSHKTHPSSRFLRLRLI